jgi:hypothetical protein
MKPVLRTLWVMAFLLTGCDDETAERQAFIDFLQQHIVSRPGVHVMLMNAELAKSFGPYASHYQIILDFNSDFNLAPLEKASRLKSQISDLDDLVAHRDDLRTLRQVVPDVIAIVDRKLAAADAAHAALQQPPDLKLVYDQAFDRLVTRPGTLLQKMLALLPSSLDAMIETADYVAKNAADIRVQGMGGTSQDPVVARHVKELVDQMHENDAAVDDLKRQFQALVNGT